MTSPLSSAQAARTALAPRLRHLRLDAGLAGHQLSVACGWHRAKTSRIENTGPFPPTRHPRLVRGVRRRRPGRGPDRRRPQRTSMYVEWKLLWGSSAVNTWSSRRGAVLSWTGWRAERGYDG